MSMITLEPQSAGYNGNNKYRIRNEGMVIMEIVPGPWWAVDEATNTATIDATYVYPYLVAMLTGGARCHLAKDASIEGKR